MNRLIVLKHWSVFEVASNASPSGTARHLVGWSMTSAGKGKVSSAVHSFDPGTQTAVTASGNSYLLLDEPEHNASAMFAWGQWKFINHVDGERDVTDLVWSEIQKSRASKA